MVLESKRLRLEEDGTSWDIFLKNTAIGQLQYKDGMLFCTIQEDYRRQNYALEACNALLDILEAETNQVSAQIKIENNAAMRLLNKLGFELRSIRGDIMTFLLKM